MFACHTKIKATSIRIETRTTSSRIMEVTINRDNLDKMFRVDIRTSIEEFLDLET